MVTCVESENHQPQHLKMNDSRMEQHNGDRSFTTQGHKELGGRKRFCFPGLWGYAEKYLQLTESSELRAQSARKLTAPVARREGVCADEVTK